MNEAEKLINRLYGNIGFTCDSCGRETNGITYVNGMKFCAKCYQETFGKDNQQNEIQQLKQQLEEKDKQIDIISRDNNSYKYNIDEQKRIIDDFAKQLKEKDKEIERLKNLFELNNEVVINQGKEMFDLRVQVLQQKQNQTQLAIQELEKVKVSLKDRISMMKNEEHSYLQKVVTWYDICDQINNQIKELKGE